MCVPYHFSVLFMLGPSNLMFYLKIIWCSTSRFSSRTLHLNFGEGKGSSLFLSLSPDIKGGVLACGAPNSNAEKKEKKTWEESIITVIKVVGVGLRVHRVSLSKIRETCTWVLGWVKKRSEMTGGVGIGLPCPWVLVFGLKRPHEIEILWFGSGENDGTAFVCVRGDRGLVPSPCPYSSPLLLPLRIFLHCTARTD